MVSCHCGCPNHGGSDCCGVGSMMTSEYGPVSGEYELNLLRELDRVMQRDLHAKIYHTEGCMKCAITQRHLEMPSEMVLISRDNPESEEIIKYMDLKGYQTAPLVFIYRGDQKVDEWNDMNVKKIRYWNGEE